MSGQTIRVETADGIRVLTVDRPEKLNALNASVQEELSSAVAVAESDSDLREGAAKDHADDATAIGAERHTHADLTGALFDTISHHSVQAHSGEY